MLVGVVEAISLAKALNSHFRCVTLTVFQTLFDAGVLSGCFFWLVPWADIPAGGAESDRAKESASGYC